MNTLYLLPDFAASNPEATQELNALSSLFHSGYCRVYPFSVDTSLFRQSFRFSSTVTACCMCYC
jgi:hypothetical protein